jgi:hypothetical protein
MAKLSDALMVQVFQFVEIHRSQKRLFAHTGQLGKQLALGVFHLFLIWIPTLLIQDDEP